MKKISIERENAYRLIRLMRDTVRKAGLSSYLEGNSKDESTGPEVDLAGTSNGFLSEVIHAITGCEVEVHGEVEERFPCPCCGFKTLTERFNPKEGTGYDICPYCNWEDDGTVNIESYRSINRGSILDYRNKIDANPNRYYINKWLKG